MRGGVSSNKHSLLEAQRETRHTGAQGQQRGQCGAKRAAARQVDGKVDGRVEHDQEVAHVHQVGHGAQRRPLVLQEVGDQAQRVAEDEQAHYAHQRRRVGRALHGCLGGHENIACIVFFIEIIARTNPL